MMCRFTRPMNSGRSLRVGTLEAVNERGDSDLRRVLCEQVNVARFAVELGNCAPGSPQAFGAASRPQGTMSAPLPRHEDQVDTERGNYIHAHACSHPGMS